METFKFQELRNDVNQKIYFDFINEITDELFNDNLFSLSINNEICTILIHIDLLKDELRNKVNLISKTNYFFDSNDFEIITINSNYFLIVLEF